MILWVSVISASFEQNSDFPAGTSEHWPVSVVSPAVHREREIPSSNVEPDPAEFSQSHPRRCLPNHAAVQDLWAGWVA